MECAVFAWYIPRTMISSFLRFLAVWRVYALVTAALAGIGAYVVIGGGSSFGETLVIKPADFNAQVSVSGTVTPAHDADLGFAASGRIKGTYAVVGERVAEGAILAAVENGDLAAALDKAKQNLAALQSGTRPEELAITRAALASDHAAKADADQAVVDAVRDAYTAADDAVRGKADQFITSPTNISIALSFYTPDDSLTNRIKEERLMLEAMLNGWSNALASSADLSGQAPSSRDHLLQTRAFLDDVAAALNAPESTTVQSKTSASSQPIPASWKSDLSAARTNVNGALTTLTSALSNKTAADAALAHDENSLALQEAGSRSEDIAAASADVENARAALAKSFVIAPFSGVVTRMDAKAGEVVSPSDSEIALQSDGIFQIDAYIPEVSIAGVATGNPATTTLDAYGPNTPFQAKVIAVDPAETVRDGVPTYKTTLVFLAEDARVRSGMTANVVIQTGVLHDAIVVPKGAVGTDASGAFVSVVVGKKVERRAVALGAAPALGEVEIVSGLSAGDVILLSPR